MYFEQKRVGTGVSVLATANERLDRVYLWDLYNSRTINRKAKDKPHRLDWDLSIPKGYQIDNMRWADYENTLFVTMEDESKQGSYKICLYELTSVMEEISEKEANGRNPIKEDNRKKEPRGGCNFKPNITYNLEIPISYFCMKNDGKYVIFGTGSQNKYIIDLRVEKYTGYFSSLKPSGETQDTDSSKVFPKEQIMVEYNQDNQVVFGYRDQKKIEIYDLRQVG